MSALRLPTLEGHSDSGGARLGLRVGGGTAAAGTRKMRSVRVRRVDIGQTEVLPVAWMLGDLAGRAAPGPDEVAEALGMRLQRVAP